MKTFRSLRHRNYRLYFIGQMLSLIGSWTQMTALMWLAHEQTHQAKWPAFLVAAHIGPTLLFGPLGGSLADRFPKRRLILGTQFAFCGMALLVLLCFGFDLLNVWAMLILLFAHGIIQAIDLPARMAFVSDLVPSDDLMNAVALNSLQFNVARALGPALAGLLLVVAGPWACFTFNAFSYWAIIAGLLLMRHLPEHLEVHDHSIAGGYRALRAKPALFFIVSMAGLVAISGWPLLGILPTYAEIVLRGTAERYSTLVSAIGIGALLAALMAATFGTMHTRRLLLFSGILAVNVALVVLALSAEYPVALSGCVLFGFGMILFFATGQSVLQMGIEKANRGKVMGIWAMVVSAGVPCGNLIFGPAADLWGVKAVVAGQACLMSMATLLFIGWRDHSTPRNNETR